MKKQAINHIDTFYKFLREHRIKTLKMQATGFWQASNQKGSARDKTEWLAVRKLAHAQQLEGFTKY